MKEENILDVLDELKVEFDGIDKDLLIKFKEAFQKEMQLSFTSQDEAEVFREQFLESLTDEEYDLFGEFMKQISVQMIKQLSEVLNEVVGLDFPTNTNKNKKETLN